MAQQSLQVAIINTSSENRFTGGWFFVPCFFSTWNLGAELSCLEHCKYQNAQLMQVFSLGWEDTSKKDTEFYANLAFLFVCL